MRGGGDGDGCQGVPGGLPNGLLCTGAGCVGASPTSAGQRAALRGATIRMAVQETTSDAGATVGTLALTHGESVTA
jgi:hypothetical protein